MTTKTNTNGASSEQWARKSVDGATRRMGAVLAIGWSLAQGISVLTYGGVALFGSQLAFMLWLFGTLPALAWTITRPNDRWIGVCLGLLQVLSIYQVIMHPVTDPHVGLLGYWSTPVIFVVGRLVLPRRASMELWIINVIGLVIGWIIATRPGHLPAAWVFPVTGIVEALGLGRMIGGLRVVELLANKADLATEASAREKVHARQVESAAEEATEIARVLHDSALNTFAAIACGRLASRMSTIRARCATDVATLTALLAHERPSAALRHRSPWETALSEDIELIAVNTTTETFAEMLAVLPESVSSAFSGSIAEAIRNSAKYSNESLVTLAVDREGDQVRVAVSDQGIGFDGAIPPDRGMQRSILDRCADAGVTVEIAAALGRGVCVELTYGGTSTSHPDDHDSDETESFLGEVVWTSLAGWTYTSISICVALTLIGSRGHPKLYVVAILALMVMTWILVYRRYDNSLSLPTWVAWAILLEMPIIVLGAEYQHPRCGLYAITAWSSLGCAPALSLLLLVHRRRWSLWAALASYLSPYVWLALTQTRLSCEESTPSFGYLGLGLFFGLLLFRRRLWSLTAAEKAANAEAHQAQLRVVETEAALRVRNVRRVHVLRSCLGLLSGLTDGTLDPYDVQVRTQCANEESYLRELTTLDPSLTYLGEWLVQALALAHTRGVILQIQSAKHDLPADVAAHIGQLLLAAVAGASSGQTLSFALSDEDGIEVACILGAITALSTAIGTVARTESSWVLTCLELDDEAIVELSPVQLRH